MMQIADWCAATKSSATGALNSPVRTYLLTRRKFNQRRARRRGNALLTIAPTNRITMLDGSGTTSNMMPAMLSGADALPEFSCSLMIYVSVIPE
jgi:hypothetical protein